jgi:hypothetical protein
MRSMIRGRSPRQRDFILQTELGRQLSNADFTGLKLTPADDLSLPMRLDAKVSMPDLSAPNPLPDFNIAALFAAPDRNRPLLINNGQKLHLVQTTEWHDTQAKGERVSFDKQVAGIHATITWKQTGDQTRVRTAELTIDQPLVAQADYVAVRQMLRNWLQTLSSSKL